MSSGIAVLPRADASLAGAQIGRRFLGSVRPKARLFVIKEVFSRFGSARYECDAALRPSALPISSIHSTPFCSDRMVDMYRRSRIGSAFIFRYDRGRDSEMNRIDLIF